VTISSATDILTYRALNVTECNFSIEFVTAKRHYRYHGITASYLPSPLQLPWLPRYCSFPRYRAIL